MKESDLSAADHFPALVLAWLSGQFAATYAAANLPGPTIGPTASALYAVLTAVAAAGLLIVATRRHRRIAKYRGLGRG